MKIGTKVRKNWLIKPLNLQSLILLSFFCFQPFLLFAQQSNILTLDLTHPTYPSEFIFTEEGYWEETFNEVDYTFLKSQIFSFSHLIEGEGSTYGGYVWNGFTVCNSGDSSNYNSNGSWVDYQWGCMAGGGIMTDAQGNILKDENGEVLVQKGLPYLVSYWNYIIEPEWWHLGYGNTFIDEPTHCMQILLDNEDEYEAVGVYVNTHPYSYYAILEGFGIAHQLNKEGDYFKLIFHGLNRDGTESGKFVEHFLAKYENNQLVQSAKWEWIDLSVLGEIGGFFCTLVSTDTNAYGPLTPVMFCMDKLQVRKKLIGISENKEVSKVQIYSHNNYVYIKKESGNEDYFVRIYDMTGRSVFQGTVHTEAVIPLQVISGIYNVVLHGRDAKDSVSTKVLITNN